MIEKKYGHQGSHGQCGHDGHSYGGHGSHVGHDQKDAKIKSWQCFIISSCWMLDWWRAELLETVAVKYLQ